MSYRLSFSVIITTVNRPLMLHDCLESLRMQSRQADQIIVVDDSISGQEITIHPDLLPYTQVLRTSGLGRSLARNAGLAVASCDFVSFLDDDDMWAKERLSKVASYIHQNPTCRAVHHNVFFFAESESTKNPYGGRVDFSAEDYLSCEHSSRNHRSVNDFSHLNIKGDSFVSLLMDNHGSLPGAVTCRRLAQSVGGFCPFLSSAEDQLFFLLVAASTEWHHLDECLVYVRLHDAQGSNSPDTLSAIITSLVLILWGGGMSRFLSVRMENSLQIRFWKKFRFLLKISLKDRNTPILQRVSNLLLLIVVASGISKLRSK